MPTSGTYQAITWVQTQNKANIYLVQNDDRVTFSNNNTQLNFANLLLSDEEYYGCGVLNGGKFTLYSSYELFIRGIKYKNNIILTYLNVSKSFFFDFKVKPTVILLLNSQIVSQNQSINLIRDSSNRIYQFVCTSVNSKPDVTLALYDTNSFKTISNSLNSILQKSCTSLNLCNNILQVNFQLLDNSFDTLKSITCSANSSLANVILFETVQRNASVFVNITGTFIISV